MTTLAIKDLAHSKDLDRQAMRSYLGGRGLGRSALFAFGLPSSSPLGGAPFVFNQFVNAEFTNINNNNTLNQLFIDNFQMNQLNQLVEITNSDNVAVDLFGNQGNSNARLLGFPIAA